MEAGAWLYSVVRDSKDERVFHEWVMLELECWATRYEVMIREEDRRGIVLMTEASGQNFVLA